MRNRKLNNILLPLVVLIWIGVLIRIFVPFESKEATPIQYPDNQTVIQTSQIEPDTFRLSLHYSDPFGLSGSSRRKKKVENPLQQAKTAPSSRPKSTTSKITSPGIDWTQFRYQGLSSSATHRTRIALIRYGSRIHYVETGDSLAGMEVYRIFPDSVWLRHEKGKQTLLLQ